MHGPVTGVYVAPYTWPMVNKEKAMAELGKRIQSAREKRGWSLEKLAGEAGVTFQTIYQLERGGREPKALTLARVAQALGESTDVLLAGLV